MALLFVSPLALSLSGGGPGKARGTNYPPALTSSSQVPPGRPHRTTQTSQQLLAPASVAMALEGRSHVRNVGWMVALSLIACRRAAGFVALPPSAVGALREGFRLNERPSPRHEPQVRQYYIDYPVFSRESERARQCVPAGLVRTKRCTEVPSSRRTGFPSDFSSAVGHFSVGGGRATVGSKATTTSSVRSLSCGTAAVGRSARNCRWRMRGLVEMLRHGRDFMQLWIPGLQHCCCTSIKLHQP